MHQIDSFEQPAYASKEEFDKLFPEHSYYAISNPELVIRLQELVDSNLYLLAQFGQNLETQFNVKRVILSKGVPVYELTQAGEDAENFDDLWIPVDSSGLGLSEGNDDQLFTCIANDDTPEGIKNEEAIQALFAQCMDEMNLIRQDTYELIGWDREIEVWVPNRPEPTTISYDIEFHFVEGMALIATPNMQREEYSFDNDLDMYVFNELRMQAVLRHTRSFMDRWGENDISPISEKEFERLVGEEVDRVNNRDLEDALLSALGNAPDKQTTSRPARDRSGRDKPRMAP